MKDNDFEIKLGEPYEPPLIVKETPSPLKIEGNPSKDQLPIFVTDYALSEARTFLDEASFRTGSFKEQAGVLLGRRCKTSTGQVWTEVVYFKGFFNPEATATAITITPDMWSEANYFVDTLNRIVLEEEKEGVPLEIVGWVHTHPGEGGAGFMSNDDRFINEKVTGFDVEGKCAYVYAPQSKHGEGSFFSRGGGGKAFGLYKRHKGYYVMEATEEQTRLFERIRVLKEGPQDEKIPESEDKEETLLEKSARRIRKILDQKETWDDLESREKTIFFQDLKVVFTSIGELEDAEAREKLARALLGKVLGQYKEVSQILAEQIKK